MVVADLIEMLQKVRQSAPVSCRLRFTLEDLQTKDTGSKKPVLYDQQELSGEPVGVVWEGGEVTIQLEKL